MNINGFNTYIIEDYIVKQDVKLEEDFTLIDSNKDTKSCEWPPTKLESSRQIINSLISQGALFAEAAATFPILQTIPLGMPLKVAGDLCKAKLATDKLYEALTVLYKNASFDKNNLAKKVDCSGDTIDKMLGWAGALLNASLHSIGDLQTKESVKLIIQNITKIQKGAAVITKISNYALKANK